VKCLDEESDQILIVFHLPSLQIAVINAVEIAPWAVATSQICGRP
jgi:hypothetical protein